MTKTRGLTYDPKHPQGNHPQEQQLCVNKPWLIHYINCGVEKGVAKEALLSPALQLKQMTALMHAIVGM